MPLNISIYDPERGEEEEREEGEERKEREEGSEEEVGSQEEKGDIGGKGREGEIKGKDEKTRPSPFVLPLPLIISSELKAAVLKKAGWDHSLYIVRMAQDSPEVLLSPRSQTSLQHWRSCISQLEIRSLLNWWMRRWKGRRRVVR